MSIVPSAALYRVAVVSDIHYAGYAEQGRPNYLVQGITNPLGDPSLSPEEEKALRKKIVLAALKRLASTPGETNDSL